MKIMIVLGTRPEIIKLSPIIRECQKRNLDYKIVHTGQHYDYDMDGIFFQELELPSPSYNLEVGSCSHGEGTGKMLIGLERVMMEEKPDVVMVLGDTNTTLAGALSASKLHINVAHVEAGMRSYDRMMPEEINRIIVDHIADYLFASTPNAKNILLREGVSENKIIMTGSTIVEAVLENIEIAKRNVQEYRRYSDLILVTTHRQETVDIEENLINIFKALEIIYDEYKISIIYPIHPRTRRNLEKFSLYPPRGVELIDPVGFLKFLYLEDKASLILTDSGGVQMEACILHTPCITLRTTTEWTETVEVGANKLVGYDTHTIVCSVREMLLKPRQWENPFGDGTASRQTLDLLLRQDSK